MTPKEQSQLETINKFLERVEVVRLSKNLRNLVFEHLAAQKDGRVLNQSELLVDMISLFELLEGIG